MVTATMSSTGQQLYTLHPHSQYSLLYGLTWLNKAMKRKTKLNVSARNQTPAPMSQPVTLWTDIMFMVTFL